MASSARIDELRKKFDENPRRYFAPLANEFRKAGDLEQAVFICQEYLPQQPGHMSGHIVYGQALFELGRDEEAKAVFETALSLDPENLIALRHLGDIARQAGDVDVARFWYQRVLESDPRNEEISQILMSIDATAGAGSPQAAASPPPIPIAEPESAAPVPERDAAPARVADVVTPEAGEIATPSAPAAESRTSDHAQSAEPASYEPFEGFDRTIDFEQPAAEAAPPPEMPPEIPAEADHAHEPAMAAPVADEQPPVAAQAAQAAQAAHSDPDELLDLEDFSIGGEAAATPAAHAAPIPAPAEAAFAEPPAIEFSESESPFSFGTEAEPEQAMAAHEEAPSADESAFELHEAGAAFQPEPVVNELAPEPPPIPETEPEPAIELATDIHLGLPPDEPEPAVEPEGAWESEWTPEAAGEPVAESTVGAHAPEAHATDTFTPADSSDAAPPIERPATDSADEVFVTETMANLYVQQGHFANALEVYEKLLARTPDDAGLEARVREIRERVYGKPHDAAAARENVWEPEPLGAEVRAAQTAVASPTIREFLRGVIAPRGAVAESAGPTPEADPPPAAPHATPAETITGSIDALFANAAPSDPDRSAANALAQAFGEWPEPTPIHGIPAHEAASELSLDHVFKANAPVPRRDEPDAFSFDQFFSDETGEAPAAGESGRGSPEPGDDIAQFNAWLNGLKKT